MTTPEWRTALDRAHVHAQEWVDSLAHRDVTPTADLATVLTSLGNLPEGPGDPAKTIDTLAEAVEPSLAGIGTGRWFGFVMGGSHPAALAADWLTSAWDQNAGLNAVTPGVIAAEIAAGRWLLDLFGLPQDSAVGFTTGATMANFTGLAAGRDALLRAAGWDPAGGLAGGPAIRVLAGAEAHVSPLLALRYLGLGDPELLPVDERGSIRPEALADALDSDPGRPVLLLLQAGNIHSGDSDPFDVLIPLAHDHDAWVHVDGAFGLWQAVTPIHRHLAAGVELADSWASDLHKTLNVPYDSGVVMVRDATALRASMSVQASYLITDGTGDQHEYVPEISRRARGVAVWATLHSLGRTGVVDLVERLGLRARQLAEGAAALPGAEVVNDVVFTQVCVSFGSDERTHAVIDHVLADGTTWMSGSRWHGRAVLRMSVSNWQTSEDDVRRSLDALSRAVSAV